MPKRAGVYIRVTPSATHSSISPLIDVLSPNTNTNTLWLWVFHSQHRILRAGHSSHPKVKQESEKEGGAHQRWHRSPAWARREDTGVQRGKSPGWVALASPLGWVFTSRSAAFIVHKMGVWPTLKYHEENCMILMKILFVGKWQVDLAIYWSYLKKKWNNKF